jgi:tetratricopeptide (TPR) repeat protein
MPRIASRTALKVFLALLTQLNAVFVANCQTPAENLRLKIYSRDVSKEEKVVACAEMADYFLNRDNDSAQFYSSLGLNLSTKHNLPSGIFRNSCVLGKVFLMKDSLEKAIAVFENARKHMAELESEEDALCILLLLGYVYDVKQDYFRAHQALYTGLRIAEADRNNEFLWSYYNNLGNHYIELKDYPKAIELYKQAISSYHLLSEEQRKFSLASSYSNLGDAFIGMKQLDSAGNYLNKALSVSGVSGDYYGLFSILSNLGEVALMKQEYMKALDIFIQAGSALDSMKGEFEGSVAPLNALHQNHLGTAYLNIGEIQQAEKYFMAAIQAARITDDLSVEADARKNLSYIYELNGNYRASLASLKRYLEFKDMLSGRISDEAITRISLEYQLETDLRAGQQEFLLQEIKNRRREIIYIFSIVTTGGLLITILLLYMLQKSKARSRQIEERNIRLEKEKIQEELEYKNKELTTNVLYLVRKNEFINSISQRLSELQDKLSEDGARKLKGIINELDNAMEDDTWDEFELRFKEVHTDFYNRLGRQFPNLTAQDLRLCAFLRLNMTNKEIAAITYQSLESLKTARYRLRKKLGLERDENLVAFLIRI